MSAGPESPEAPWPLGNGVRLLHRDVNGVVALAKPAGVLSHPNVAGDEVRRSSSRDTRWMRSAMSGRNSLVSRRASYGC